LPGADRCPKTVIPSYVGAPLPGVTPRCDDRPSRRKTVAGGVETAFNGR